MNALAFGEYELKLFADTEGPKAVVAAGNFAGRDGRNLARNGTRLPLCPARVAFTKRWPGKRRRWRQIKGYGAVGRAVVSADPLVLEKGDVGDCWEKLSSSE